jgi:hypothetical protein
MAKKQSQTQQKVETVEQILPPGLVDMKNPHKAGMPTNANEKPLPDSAWKSQAQMDYEKKNCK